MFDKNLANKLLAGNLQFCEKSFFCFIHEHEYKCELLLTYNHLMKQNKMNVLSKEFFERYLTFEYLSVTEMFACAILPAMKTGDSPISRRNGERILHSTISGVQKWNIKCVRMVSFNPLDFRDNCFVRFFYQLACMIS